MSPGRGLGGDAPDPHAQHPPLRPGDLKGALKTVWEVYSAFYVWIDPEESYDDDEEEDDL